MSGSLHVIETVRRVALLGVRCLDAATGTLVTAGLRVAAVPVRGGSWTAARPAAAGIFAFHRLPGLHAAAFGEDVLDSPPTQSFALLVTDQSRRYQGVGLLVDAPRRQPLTLRLLRLPAAPPAPGVLTLRGTLQDATRLDSNGMLLPAAFALIEALRGDEAEPVLGLSDERGEFVVVLPHPDPLGPHLDYGTGSPASRPTLAERNFPLLLRFRYQPSRQRWLQPTLRGAALRDTAAPDAVPEIEALQSQTTAELAPPWPPGAASPPDGLEIQVSFAATAVVGGSAAEGSVRLLPAPPDTP
jgi:hypothetical protein